MPHPVLRALMESGAVWKDPSEDMLFELLTDIEDGREQFLVVERTADTSGQTYVQSIREGDATYVVERRDGAPEAHFRIGSLSKRDAHAILTGWAFELSGWATDHPWEPVAV
jgi:hypothetical protein